MAYMASADPLIAGGHPVSTAMFTVNVSQLPNMIKNKQFRFISEKTLKATRDSELINCRKRAAVLVDQLCAVGW